MIIIAIDLGKSRTGLAVCDRNQILASPFGVIYEKNQDILVEKILEKIKISGAQKIVIGLPKNMDGTLGDSARWVSSIADTLEKSSNLPVVLWDERLTTVMASGYLNRLNVRSKKRKSIIDTLSATIILESYINYKNNSLLL